MATTTPNYGWSVPTSTDLVKDGAVAIETLGDSADATVKALNPETTLGDISYRSSTANTKTRLAIGTTGQVLTVASGVPSWATPAGGGGKVLQVVNATTSTVVTSTSATFVDTTLTATITPTLATSKILVLVSQNGLGKYSGNAAIAIKLVRGATDLIRLEDLATYDNATGSNYVGSVSTNYLDAPATTSATTYKTTFANRAATGNAEVQSTYGSALSGTSTITLMEIGA